MVLSIAKAQKMIKDLKNREISLGRDPKTWYTYENHICGVAQIAKIIAGKLKTMNPDHLYVMGLLHDICRTEDRRTKRFHGIAGYEKLIQSDPEAARACLLHTFPWNELPPYRQCATLFYQRKKDYQFIADFIRKNPPKDEDYLIQLCDYLANKNGFVTIEERAEEIIERHRNTQDFADIVKINELKEYFEEKIGENIYDLFKVAAKPAPKSVVKSE